MLTINEETITMTTTTNIQAKQAAVETAKQALAVHKAGGIEENITAAKKKLHAAQEALRRFKQKTGAATDAEVKAQDAEFKASEAKMAAPVVVVEVPCAKGHSMSWEAKDGMDVGTCVNCGVVEKFAKAAIVVEAKADKAAKAYKKTNAAPKAAKEPKAAKPVVEKPLSTKTYKDLAEYLSAEFASYADDVITFLGLETYDRNLARNIVRRSINAVGASFQEVNGGDDPTVIQMPFDGENGGHDDNMKQAQQQMGAKFNERIPLDERVGTHPAHPRCHHCGKPMFKSMNVGKVFKSDAWAFCRNPFCAQWDVDQAKDTVAARPELFLAPEAKSKIIADIAKADAEAKASAKAAKAKKAPAAAAQA